MVLLGEKIGPRGFQSLHSEYFPIMAILDTEEILGRIGREWKNPGPSEGHSVAAMDEIFSDWVVFCDNALKGHQIGVETVKEGKISIDLVPIKSHLAFYRAMGKEEYPKIITSVRDAFTEILSEKAKQKLGKTSTGSKVDSALREKINTFVTNMGVLTNQYVGSERNKWRKFDND